MQSTFSFVADAFFGFWFKQAFSFCWVKLNLLINQLEVCLASCYVDRIEHGWTFNPYNYFFNGAYCCIYLWGGASGIALFIAATVLLVVFISRWRKQANNWKNYKGTIILSLVFYGVSIFILVSFTAWFIPLMDEDASTVRYENGAELVTLVDR